MGLPSKISKVIDDLLKDGFNIKWNFDYYNYIATCDYKGLEISFSYFFDPNLETPYYRIDLMDIEKNEANFVCDVNDNQFKNIDKLYNDAQANNLNFGVL